MPLVKKPVARPAPSENPDWRAQVALLQAGSPDERWSAARALAAEPLAVPVLDAALAAADPRLKEAIFTSLARQNSTAGFDAVLRHLRSEDAALRSFALDAMRLMPEQTERRLPALLRDGDPDIRILASELARQLPPGIGAALLAGLLAHEAEVNVCAAAIELLAEIGGPSDLPLLEACAARFPEEFFLNFSVKTATAQIRVRFGA